MSFGELESRFSPPVIYGRDINVRPQNRVIYDGTFFTYFLLKNGAEPFDYREMLIQNQIGSAFDLESGKELSIVPKSVKLDFPSHPEA